MAEINYEVYGAEADWIDVSQSYPQDTPVYDRVQYANFGDNTPTLGKAIEQHKLTLGTEIDRSLSFCGLGHAHPLSNISWWMKEGTNSQEPDEQNIYKFYKNDQKRSATNFALGTNTKNIDGPSGDKNGGYVLTNEGGNNKFKFNRWDHSGVYDGYYSNYAGFSPFTRVPVKRMVLLPRVVARKVDGTDERYYTITEYENAKATHPYLMQVGFGIYYQTDMSKYTPGAAPAQDFVRSGMGDTSSICLLEYCQGFGGLRDTTSFPEVNLGSMQLPLISGNATNAVQNDTMIPIAGDLYACVGLNMNADATVLRAYASGFGLNWDKYVKDEGNTSDVDGKLPGHVVCDVSSMSYKDVREAVRHMVACFGMFFCEDIADVNLALDDEKMFLGILDDGIGNGKYSNGEDNRDQDQWRMLDMHDVEYNPNIKPAPDPSPDPENNPDSVLEAANRELQVPGANIYVSTIGQFQEVKDAAEQLYAQVIAAAEDGDYDEAARLQGLFGHTENPADCYYSILVYPFDITKHLSLTPTHSARVGKSDFTASTDFYHATGATKYGVIDAGQIYFPYWEACGGMKNSSCYLNYSPYSSATLSVPFCGSIRLDPAIWAGTWVGVRYLVDWRTGNCQALICRCANGEWEADKYGVVMETLNGQMAYRVNFSQANANSYANTILQSSAAADDASRNRFQTLITHGSQAVANLAQMGTNPLQGAQGLYSNISAIQDANDTYDIAKYNLEQKEIPVQQISTASPAINTLGELSIRLNIYRPTFYTTNGFNYTYAHRVGFACLEFVSLQNKNGYNVVDKIETSGISGATDKEKALIKQLCASGIYVNYTPPTPPNLT